MIKRSVVNVFFVNNQFAAVSFMRDEGHNIYKLGTLDQ